MSYTPNTWQTGDTITATKLNNMEQGIADTSYDLVIKLNSTTGNATLYNASSATLISGTFAACETKAQTNKQPLKVLVYCVDTNSANYPFTRTFGVVNTYYSNYAYSESEYYVGIVLIDLTGTPKLCTREIFLYPSGNISLGTIYYASLSSS